MSRDESSVGGDESSVGGDESSVGGDLAARYRAVVGSRRFAEFTGNTLNVVALGVILLVAVVAVFAEPIVLEFTVQGVTVSQTVQPVSLAPYDPAEIHLGDRLEPPSPTYLLGTDELGRDILSRLLVGARISMRIGLAVVTIALVVGTTVGLVAGYLGGLVDEALMRLVDVVLAFPGILLALVIAGILGPSLTNIMIALAVVGWTQYARVVRGSVLSVKEQEFVKASQVMGVPRLRILVRHLLPNVISPVVVLATMDMAYVVLGTAGLSFLGLGAQPPTPEWGTMLSTGVEHLEDAWWVANVPGGAIMLTVLAFNILGDSLRDILDPRELERVEGKGM